MRRASRRRKLNATRVAADSGSGELRRRGMLMLVLMKVACPQLMTVDVDAQAGLVEIETCADFPLGSRLRLAAREAEIGETGLSEAVGTLDATQCRAAGSGRLAFSAEH